MAINSTKRVIHRFIREISAYEFGGELYSQIIPLDTQAYAIYPNEEGNRFFYVIGDGEHTYTEIRDGKGNGEACKEYPVFTKDNLNIITSAVEQEAAERKAADELLQLQINNEKLTREQIDEYLQQQIDDNDESISEIQRNLTKEVFERKQAVEEERIARTNSDESLIVKLDKEIEERKHFDELLDEALGEEIQNREAAITNLFNELKADIDNHANNKENPHQVTKAQIGLGNVDNTSDLGKPISIATQNALDEISVSLSNEETRAISKENELESAITSEILRATQAEESLSDTKLDKISDVNKVYGTDSQGDQIGYNIDSFGKVDDIKINDISIVSNKIANLGTMAKENCLDYYTSLQIDSKNYQTENQVETKISDKLEDYTTTSELQANYVAKESGKGLSTNDYSNTDKEKVDSLGTMSTESAADYSTKIVADTLYADKSIEQTLSTEITNRENADTNLQSQIDAITVSSDVTDIVGSYADLENYDTTSLAPNSIVKVLQDENRNDETTYYRWIIEENIGHWFLVGEEGPYYTKSEADSKFVSQERTINGKNLSSNITLSASDVGADSSGLAAIAEQNAKDYADSLASNYATAGQGQLADTAIQPDDLATVAISGDYNDLSNLPEIPSAQIQSDWNQTDDRALDYIKNKPYIPSEVIVDQNYDSTSTHAQSGVAVSQAISGKQDVLTSGSNITIENGVISATDTTYTAGVGISIENGVISNTQTSAEWGNITGTLNDQTDLKNVLDTKVDKLTLATVATSGDYDDLVNKPVNVSEFINDANYVIKSQLETKQDTLVSGTNIKTVNNQSLLGSGNIEIEGGSSTAEEIINANEATGAINPLSIWQGAEQEYNQYEMISWKNWKTDTNVSQTSIVTVPFNCSSSRQRQGVKLLGGKHVASKNGFIYYSDDGVNWTNYKINANYNSDFLLEYHNGTYYAFTSSSSITRYSSTDLVNWTEDAGDGSASNGWYDICFVGNRLIGWDSGGLVVSDDNGLTWANFTPPEGGYSADNRGISYVNGIGFYSRNSGNDFTRPIDLWTSTDGATWTLANKTSGSAVAGSYKIAYGNGIYVMICTTYNSGYNACARTSTDGINWSDVYPLNLNMGTNVLNAQAYSITFVNGRFLVACRNASVVAYSEDGETWQQANCATMNTVVYGFLPVASNSTAVAYNFNSGTEQSLSSPIILVYKKECYTLDSEPTASSVIYSEPSVEAQLTVTTVGVDSITLSDGYVYNRNSGSDTNTYRNVGEVHQDWICNINNVGIKIGNTLIADNTIFDTVPTQGSTNAITSGAVYEVLGNLETALYNFNSRTE